MIYWTVVTVNDLSTTVKLYMTHDAMKLILACKWDVSFW